MDGQDAAPTPVMSSAYDSYCRDLVTASQGWNALMKTDLANLNGELAKAHLGPITAAPVTVPACR